MTASEQNQDFHWLNHIMVENRVSGNHLVSIKQRDILDVQNITCLPNVTYNIKQRMDYIILTSRMISN